MTEFLESAEDAKEIKKETIKLLNRIYKMSAHYKSSTNNDYRLYVLDICEPVLARLEKFNVHRAFSETLLAYGDEFLMSEFGVTWGEMRKRFNA